MLEKYLEIANESGLHARPAADLVKKANGFKSKITIERDGKVVDAKSILGVLSLGANKGAVIHLTVVGEDELQALNELTALLVSFGKD